MPIAKNTLNDNLLIASGVGASCVVAFIHLQGAWLQPALLLYLGFIGLLLASANRERLQWPLRRRQGSCVAMLGLSVAALTVHPDTSTLILSVVLMASVPYHFSQRGSWRFLLVANLAYLIILEFSWQSRTYLVAWASLIALQGFAITSSLAKVREEQQQELLTCQNSELIAARAVIAQKSQAEERLRIAGDLHDTIGHQLTALRLQLEALSYSASEELKPQVDACQQLSSEILEALRSIVRSMSEQQSQDLEQAIKRLGALIPDVSLSVVSELPALSMDLSQQLLFCIQEGIHNAVRHGDARQITIRYQGSALRIQDDGVGFTGASPFPGFGLANINKRLQPFGGRGELVRGVDNQGCELVLHLGQQGGSET